MSCPLLLTRFHSSERVGDRSIPESGDEDVAFDSCGQCGCRETALQFGPLAEACDELAVCEPLSRRIFDCSYRTVKGCIRIEGVTTAGKAEDVLTVIYILEERRVLRLRNTLDLGLSPEGDSVHSKTHVACSYGFNSLYECRFQEPVPSLLRLSEDGLDASSDYHRSTCCEVERPSDRSEWYTRYTVT